MKRWFILLLLAATGCATTSPDPALVLGEALAGAATGSTARLDTPSGKYLTPSGRGVDADLVDSHSLLAGDGLQEMLDGEFQPEEATDPETLADNILLAGVGENPPDDEGVTVAAEVSFDFPVVENEKVRYFIDYYTGRGRPVFTRWLERSSRYVPLMQQIFAEEGLPLDLVYLAMVESGFNTRAYSWAHAVGPWQFIPSTGRLHGLKSDWWYDERRDFEKSTRAAAQFLNYLYKRFDGDWYLAVASYNAGPGKISRAVKMYNTRDFWELSRGKYLQLETKHYVPKLLAALTIVKQPEKYGFTDLNPAPPLDYEVTVIPSTTDLDLVAKFCEVDYEQIKGLNPELMRWCTPPQASRYELRLPAGTREKFEQRYAELPKEKRANYLHHRIKSGDTLGGLASRYKIRVQDIVSLNGIKDPRALRIGTDLILPLSKNYSRLPLAELKDDYNRTRRQTYTVRQGDSLWSIAKRFGVSEKELRVWNRLGWKNVIRPGQALVVSSNSSRPAPKAPKAGGAPQKIVYKVKAGDTLWRIGQQYQVATREIMDWNNLSADQVLRPGDKLTLMVRGG